MYITRTRAFTLIEVLIVISIISIIISIATVSYSEIQKRARDGRRKSDIAKISVLLQRYYQDNGRYPPGNSGGSTVTSSQSYQVQTPWITGLDRYSDEVPRDPINISTGASPGGYFYLYETWNNGQSYHLMINLENNNDSNRRALSGSSLTYSPCDESSYYRMAGSYKNFPQYDYCISNPDSFR